MGSTDKAQFGRGHRRMAAAAEAASVAVFKNWLPPDTVAYDDLASTACGKDLKPCIYAVAGGKESHGMEPAFLG
eukprot:1169319-Alexandrium_andersonii.AAC.1